MAGEDGVIGGSERKVCPKCNKSNSNTIRWDQVSAVKFVYTHRCRECDCCWTEEWVLNYWFYTS